MKTRKQKVRDTAALSVVPPSTTDTAPVEPADEATPAGGGPTLQPPLVLFSTGTPAGGWLRLAENMLTGAPSGVDLRRPALSAWLDGLADPASTRTSPKTRSALAALAPPDTPAWGCADARACWVLDALADAYPQARFLLFVAAPADALADWLSSSSATSTEAGSPQEILAAWRDGAARLLRHLQRHPGRSLLVDVREAEAEPVALAALCAEQWGLRLSPSAAVARELDPLLTALASALAAQDPAALALYAELQASCPALAADNVAHAHAPAFDGAQATLQFRAMASTAAEVPALRVQLVQAREAAESKASLLQLAADDGVALQERLHAATQDIEALKVGAADAERRLVSAASDLAAARQAAATQAGEAQARIQVSDRERARLQAELEAASKRESERKAQFDAVSAQLQQQRQEGELLLLNLQHVQEELESTWLKLREAERLRAELEPKLTASDATVKKLTGERDAATKLATERAVQVEALNKEKTRLTAERDAASKHAAERAVQIDGLNKDKSRLAELEPKLTASEATVKKLTGERDAATKLAAERAAQVEALNKEKTRLTAERDAAAKQAAERAAQIDGLNKDKSRLAELEPKLTASEATVKKLTGERDAATKLAAERAAQVEALNKEKTRLTAERDAAAKQAAERAAQIDGLSKDKSRLAELEPKLTASVATVKKLTGERDAATKLAAERAAQVDALSKDKSRLAELEPKLNASEATVKKLTGERDAAAKQAKERQVQIDDAQARYRALAQDLEAVRAQHGAAQQENELLLLHLHQVQEELEKHYLELQQSREQPVAAAALQNLEPAAGLPQGLVAGLVSIGVPRVTPPHLELQFKIEHLTLDGVEEIPELRMRLVEHHGNAGIAFFSDADAHPFQRWQESGQEEGNPYMLLVPADFHAWPLLRALSLRDWRFLNLLVTLLESRLLADAPELAPRWTGVASRLRRELAELPPAARYRTVEATAAQGALDLHFSSLQWGVRELDGVHLHLPVGGDGAFELSLEDGAASDAPLTNWPRDDAGVPQPRLALRPGRGADPAAAAWAALTTTDCEFVLSLLSCLPQVAASLPEGSESATLVAHAAAQLQPIVSRATPEGARPRPAARRLIRRLLGRDPAEA